MSELSEYTLIPVKLTPSSEVTRHLRVKKYESDTCPGDRSIFIANVPPLVTTSALRLTLSKAYGKISSLSFVEESKSITDNLYKIQHNSATVTFANKTSVDKILSTPPSQSPLSLTCDVANGRIESLLYLSKLNYNKSIITLDKGFCEKVDHFVESYKQFSERREKTLKEMSRNEPDEEGWITVKHKGKHNLNKDKSMSLKDRAKLIKKKRIESSISAAYQYRMRTKDEKYARLRELRARFEEDKFKLAQMKTGRKFKPM